MGMKIYDRYSNDSAFRNIVDMMRMVIERGEFTPSEIREAAMLAQIMYEDRKPRQMIFTREEVVSGKV